MQLVYSPVLPPGCCFICRASVRESYIDTAVSKDYEGAYYICNMCVMEMAHMMAFMSFDEYKDLRAAKEDLERMNFELIKRVGQLEGIHDALAIAGYKLSDDGNVARVGGYIPTADERKSGRVFFSEEPVGVGEGEIVESLHDEGVDELRSNELPDASEFSLDL